MKLSSGLEGTRNAAKSWIPRAEISPAVQAVESSGPQISTLLSSVSSIIPLAMAVTHLHLRFHVIHDVDCDDFFELLFEFEAALSSACFRFGVQLMTQL